MVDCFSDIICSPLIFPFFQSRSTCQRDGLVMAPFAAKKRRRNASSGSYQTPEAKRTKKSRRESQGRSVMPATVGRSFPLITKYFGEVNLDRDRDVLADLKDEIDRLLGNELKNIAENAFPNGEGATGEADTSKQRTDLPMKWPLQTAHLPCRCKECEGDHKKECLFSPWRKPKEEYLVPIQVEKTPRKIKRKGK